MAYCLIRTPDTNIDNAFSLLDGFLRKYKIDRKSGKEPSDVWAPGVPGYGIDEATPFVQDTRDNRWLVWAARYCEGDDDFLSRAAPAILTEAFLPDGRERHEAANPSGDDYLHYYVRWLLQVALGYLYTDDTSLDSARIRRIVERVYSLFDSEGIGMPHTSIRFFVTSIGEPFNTMPGQAYDFFGSCTLAFSLRQFADLAVTLGDAASRRYFEERLDSLLRNIRSFRSPEGFYYALKDRKSGAFRFRVTDPDSTCVMTDNVFFPLVFGVLSQSELQPSIEYLLPHIKNSFPVPYAHPPYRGDGTMAWWIPRSWQECLAHSCLGLRELEMPWLVSDLIKRQADRIAQDGEVWEHYDPGSGAAEGHHVPARRGYSTTSACLNIAIIEGLFGIRPEAPGFTSVSIRPAFPDSWPFAGIDTVLSGKRIVFTISASRDRIVYDFSESSNILAGLVLPLPRAWKVGKVRANIGGSMRLLKGEDRACFEAGAAGAAGLSLQSLRVELKREN